MSDIPPEGAPTPVEPDEAARRQAYLEELDEARADSSGGWSRTRGDRGSTPEPTPESKATQEAIEPDADAAESSDPQEGVVPDPLHAVDAASHEEASATAHRPARARRVARHAAVTVLTRDTSGPPTEAERAARFRHAPQVRAILRGETGPSPTEVAKMKEMMTEELALKVVPNRPFDRPFLPMHHDAEIDKRVEAIDQWIAGCFALEDKFGPSVEGFAQRSAVHEEFAAVADPQVVDAAWDELLGKNKLDLDSLYGVADELESIKGALLIDTQKSQVRIKRDQIVKRLRSLIPPASEYADLSYEQQEAIVRSVEEGALDFLWTLQDGEYAEGVDLHQESWDTVAGAKFAKEAAMVRYGDRRAIVGNKGDGFRVVKI